MTARCADRRRVCSSRQTQAACGVPGARAANWSRSRLRSARDCCASVSSRSLTTAKAGLRGRRRPAQRCRSKLRGRRRCRRPQRAGRHGARWQQQPCWPRATRSSLEKLGQRPGQRRSRSRTGRGRAHGGVAGRGDRAAMHVAWLAVALRATTARRTGWRAPSAGGLGASSAPRRVFHLGEPTRHQQPPLCSLALPGRRALQQRHPRRQAAGREPVRVLPRRRGARADPGAPSGRCADDAGTAPPISGMGSEPWSDGRALADARQFMAGATTGPCRRTRSMCAHDARPIGVLDLVNATTISGMAGRILGGHVIFVRR